MQRYSHRPKNASADARLAGQERAVLATLLAECPPQLPPVCAKLLANAPESFDDLRHGAIAAAMRELSAASKPVNVLTVEAGVSFADAREFLAGLEPDALPLDLAEFEAADVWTAYRNRRLAAALSDAQAALLSQPDMAPAIIDGVRSTLDYLTAPEDARNGLTIRAPDEILAMQFDNSDVILGDRLLAKGQSLVLAGAGSIGKSRLLLQLAACCLTERQFLPFVTRGTGLRWLILQAENSNRRLHDDLARLREWIGPEAWPAVNSGLTIHTLETDADGFLALDDPAAVKRMADLIAKTKPDVLAFDALYDFGAGDLSHDVDMRATLTTISRLVRAGNPDRACLVLHHALTGKAGAARAIGFDRSSFGRNSKVLHSWTRGQVNIAPGTAEDNNTLVLTCGKCSNGREFAPFAVRLNPATMVYELAPDFDLATWEAEVAGKADREPLMIPDRVRELCKGPMSKAELAKAVVQDCGCYRGSAYRYIVKAEKARKLKFNPSNELYTPR